MTTGAIVLFTDVSDDVEAVTYSTACEDSVFWLVFADGWYYADGLAYAGMEP